MRRIVASRKLLPSQDVWPVDPASGATPDGWSGWPDDKRFAIVLTHDVETSNGHAKCRDLVALERALGFRSAFNFVAERYPVSAGLRDYLAANGFEVGVHGLYHDGKKFKSRNIFDKRVPRINKYLKDWNATGFRSPSMYCNLDWLHDLDIKYDCSTFDTDPFEPQLTLQRLLTGADSLLAMRAIGQMVFPLSPLNQLEHGFKVLFPNWQQHLKKYPKLRYGNGRCFFPPI
ncbi:MAG: hypothetical protein ACLP3B_21590 [Syntrophobacteraceae bacterium]